MKSILSTCALFLLLSWKVTGETTLRPSTKQHEDTSNNQETIIKDDEPVSFIQKNITLTLKPNGETTHSPRLHKGTFKDHETTTRGNEPTNFFQTIPEDTSEESKNVFSSKSALQTSEHQHVTSMSHAENLNHTMISTGERRSTSHVSSLPFLTELTQKMTDQITITPPPQIVSEEVITTIHDYQTLHNIKSTKGFDRYMHGNRTTRSTEKEPIKSQTDISTHFQKAPEVISYQPGLEVQTKETLTTKWSSLPQETEHTHPEILNVTDSNGTFSNEERNGTDTYPRNTSNTTDFSAGLTPTVNTEIATTDTMDTKATYEITTKGTIKDGLRPNPNNEATPTIQTDTTKPANPKSPIKDNNKKSHPGQIVASVIGSILFLMFVAFVVILVRNHKLNKKKMDNPDWAGPSPFIEADIQPNLPAINDDGSFNCRESKRISLHTFLPQRLSKRLSMLNPIDEEIPLENAHVSTTFEQCNVQPQKGKATPDQIQTNETNNTPAELSSGSNVPETVSIPSAPENNENIQTTAKLEDEMIPFPPEDTNSDPPFEDVDLNLSLDKSTESISPPDAINIPSPPPLAPS